MIPTGLFKTTDAGNSWFGELVGFPAGGGGPIIFHPIRPGTLYAGASGVGVFRSKDAGTTWHAYSYGLPEVPGIGALAITVETIPKLVTGSHAITIAPVPGDCDDDSEVSIGEVQRAVNMFVWGTTPACHVDRDGSGTVTIGEVQSVINVFLGLVYPCP